MTALVLIAALDRRRLIGSGGRMPWHLPGDLRRFRARTWGQAILMGRTTFEGLGRPLPGRRNLVLSRDPGFQAEGVEVFSQLEAALAAVPERPELWVIGGARIYALTLPRAERLHLTLVDTELDGDTWFPALPPAWRATAREDHPADGQNPYACADFRVERAPEAETRAPLALPPGWLEAPPAEGAEQTS